MRYLLDSWLNRISMYRLLSITLSILWGSALGLSLLGALDFSPLAVIVSGVVLVLVTTLSNRLFGLMFGLQPHDESSYITALILFCIFTPSFEIEALLVLSIIGVLASASKYLLAIHGRHIFNPAAAAAVISSLTGLAFASWWVATPLLLPFTLIFAFFILYKTRRLQMGALFLSLSIPIIVTVLLADGASLTEALLLLMSWPLLFFVGFMLSEPLTLPPKKWQRLVEAVVVGVLFALPMYDGPLALGLAGALIIGNGLAFLFSQRRSISLTLADTRQLTPSSREFRFDANRPLTFQAGQYMEITIPHTHKDGRGLRRIFSITTAPGQSVIGFGVKFYEPSSTFKKMLKTLQSGEVIQATMISGDFTLPKNTNEPLLFIAGGIGITPFISHLLHMQATGQTRDIILLYMVSDVKEIAYADTLQQSGIKVIVCTPTAQKLPVKKWLPIHTQQLTAHMVKKAIPDVAARKVYISGAPTMINRVKKQLKHLGVKKIKSDYFTGY
ncbi:MAG TPA: hypothetical protein VFM68_02025 [Candidatus Saccharimonadales bacterium]|nr:hypothetical protein [Candidatus Saccharimonadales bacterium]